MKEYAFVLLMLAGMITLVAVAFAAVVYLRYRFGHDTLKFELSRIAIVWVAIIALLLMIGVLVATVAGWTSENVAAAFNDVLEWARHNRIMSEILLCGVTILLIALLMHLEVFTFSSFITISLLHVWATYAIWNSEDSIGQFFWIFFKIVVACIVGAAFADADVFNLMHRRNKGKGQNNSGQGQTNQSTQPTQPATAQSSHSDASQNAIEAIAETIAQHVDPIVQTVQD